jgi:hypothetical protein
MATEQTRAEDDEPTEEEIEQQKRQEKTWKHDDSRELSDRDQERPLKPLTAHTKSPAAAGLFAFQKSSSCVKSG